MEESWRRWLEEAKKDKTDDECWEVPPFPGGGRRHAWYDGRDMDLYRISYTVNIGPIPPDLQVCHVCDNGHCCNPKHLFLGTQQDNVRDAVLKGRHRKFDLGEQHHNAKFTEEQIVDIRRQRTSGVTYRALAHQYGVSNSTIYAIVNHRTWKEVT